MQTSDSSIASEEVTTSEAPVETLAEGQDQTEAAEPQSAVDQEVQLATEAGEAAERGTEAVHLAESEADVEENTEPASDDESKKNEPS